MQKPTAPIWPDDLSPPDPEQIIARLTEFWTEMAQLGPELADAQWLLAAERIVHIRQMVLEMMLALNGIARPPETKHLNRYLSSSQRQALEKTHLLPTLDAEGLVGQAVALTVIYRWYAPQLLTRFGGSYPAQAEQIAWERLTKLVGDWPRQITTD